MGSHKVALLGNKRIKVLSVFFLQSVYYNSYSNKEPLNSANVAPINSHAECQQYTIVSCSLERAVVLEKLQKNAPTPYGQQIWPSRGGWLRDCWDKIIQCLLKVVEECDRHVASPHQAPEEVFT